MNLKREIKISELVRRPTKPKKPGVRRFPETASTRGWQGVSRRRRREVVGLKLGASQLAASRVANNGSPKLLQIAREPMPPGIVGGGEVRSVPALGAALDEFFTKHTLPRRGVRLGVATNRIGVRAFDMAGVEDDRQLSNAVRFRAHEAVSIPIDEAVLDYHVATESVDASGSINRRIVLAAAYRESIDRFTAACKEAGLELVGIDLEAFALLRAVAPRAEADEQGQGVAVIAVTIGHDRTTLAVSDGDLCDFTRVLEWGGSNLTSAISRALNNSIAEAEDLKLSLSLEGNGLEEDSRPAAAREAVRTELQTLARELVASLHFYQTQPESLAIGEILVAGGTTRMPGLLDELERLTRLVVRRREPARAPRARKRGRGSRRSRVARGRNRTRTGRLMRPVNLLPDARHDASSKAFRYRVAAPRLVRRPRAPRRGGSRPRRRSSRPATTSLTAGPP